MADLNITAEDVRYIESTLQANIVPTVGYEAGQVLAVDGTTGKYALADAGASPAAMGVAINSNTAGYGGGTIIKQGVVGLGDALGSIDVGAPIYLSATTAGTLADSGTIKIGEVVSIVEVDGTLHKALRVMQ